MQVEGGWSMTHSRVNTVSGTFGNISALASYNLSVRTGLILFEEYLPATMC